jgi:hypothetical protein
VLPTFRILDRLSVDPFLFVVAGNAATLYGIMLVSGCFSVRAEARLIAWAIMIIEGSFKDLDFRAGPRKILRSLGRSASSTAAVLVGV